MWQAAPRGGDESRLLQGLIALAAAGVKVRQGQPDGIARHARRAAAFFAGLPPCPVSGFARDSLVAFAEAVARAPARPAASDRPEVVFPAPLLR